MQQLCVQIYIDNQWQDAMQLEFTTPDAGRAGPVKAAYSRAFTARYFQASAAHQVCSSWPIELLAVYRHERWHACIDDIMPAGAGRKLWVKQLELEHLSGPEQDFQLLHSGTIAPVGHLRIKESVQQVEQQLDPSLRAVRFDSAAVIERDADFLHYARQMGAISGGATGAGGEAPKLLLRQSSDHKIWFDPLQRDNTTPDQHYLVKFARGQRTETDKAILRTEYHYYQELAELGIDTIDTRQMKLEEGTHTPSLWLPRFDRVLAGGEIQRLAVESVYSLMNKGPGQYLDHHQVLQQLLDMIQPADINSFIAEYLKRDLLNLCFGNSDNHGRNMAVLKNQQHIALAPVFDFAPMKADAEGIVRTTNWNKKYQLGGVVDWLKLCSSFDEFSFGSHGNKVDSDQLFNELRTLAQKIIGLRERLAARGVPALILDMPVMGFNTLDKNLQKWGLV